MGSKKDRVIDAVGLPENAASPFGSARVRKSFSRTVPVLVPSLFHSSCPCTPSFAVKTTESPRLAKSAGYDPAVAFVMFLTRTVPASVPSLFHSSVPWTPSSAATNSWPPAAGDTSHSQIDAGLGTRPNILDQRRAGCRTVAGPQLTSVDTIVGVEHQPAVDICEVEQKGAVGPYGEESVLMSLTNIVPASVPSLFHSSVP